MLPSLYFRKKIQFKWIGVSFNLNTKRYTHILNTGKYIEKEIGCILHKNRWKTEPEHTYYH